MIHVRRSLQFSKAWEQLGQILIRDTPSVVLNVYLKLFLFFSEAYFDPYRPILGEFDSILNEIDQNLFETPRVSEQ